MNIDLELMFYMVVANAVIVIFILIYIYIKDNEQLRKFRLYEKAFEELNQNQINIQTTLKSSEKGQLKKSEVLSLLDNSEKSMEEGIEALVEKIKEIDMKIDSLQSDMVSQIKTMEEEHSIQPPTINTYTSARKDNTDRVLEMHENGFGSETIAKELKMTIGEIEFIIKRSQMMHS